MPITHHMACEDCDVSTLKFSDFPYLKKITFFGKSLFDIAKYWLTPLLVNNPNPGRSLRKITIIASMNGEFFEETE